VILNKEINAELSNHCIYKGILIEYAF
jgi:hypothetical protein